MRVSALFKILQFCVIASLPAFFSGCALFGPDVPPVVGDSQLNSLQVTYTPAQKDYDPVYVNIITTGYIHMKKGKSPRVRNSFSHEVDHPDWNNIREEKIGVPPDVARAWMQKFFNAGLATEGKKASKRAKDPLFGKEMGVARFVAQLDRDKYFAVTDNPDLIKPLLQLVGIIESGKEYE